MSDITVVTVVENDCGLLDLMIRSVRKFTTPEPDIIICENGKSSVVLDKYRKDKRVKIISNNPGLSGGSNRHGSGLNAVIAHAKTKYIAVIESDCVLVSSAWAEFVGGYSAALSHKGIHAGRHIYYAAFMILETHKAKLIDFRPGTKRNRSSGKSYKPHEDVGWDIHNHIKPSDVLDITCVDCKSGRGLVLGSEFQSEEYWVNNQPIVVHFGRGSNLGGKAKRKGFKSHKEQLSGFKASMERILDQ